MERLCLHHDSILSSWWNTKATSSLAVVSHAIYWQHFEEKPCVNFFSLLFKNFQVTLMHCYYFTILWFCKKLFLCMFFFYLIYKGNNKAVVTSSHIQASGVSTAKKWQVIARLRYRAFLFYSPSKLVTAKRFPWWKISFNIYFLPDTLLFFYWVECVFSLSEQVFMQSWQ